MSNIWDEDPQLRNEAEEESKRFLHSRRRGNGNTHNGKGIRCGDHVQWTSGGQDHFASPRRVVWLSDEGDWARVERSNTDIPVDELTITGRVGAQHEPPDLGEWDFGAAGIVPAELPPRSWLLGNVMCRQFVSSILGDGAVGKTALRIACALSLATGRPLLGLHVFERVRVLLLCFEDGETELKRRICAAMLYYGLGNTDIEGYLFVRALTDVTLKLAAGRFEVAAGTLGGAIEAAIDRRGIGAVILDPFVKTHSVAENDNAAIDFVTELLADLAVHRNVAIDVPHHVSKGLPDPGNADRGRGASAFKDGSRLVYTLAPMSSAEAAIYDIPDQERLRLVRMDQAKVNLIRRADGAAWFRLVGVPLGNRTQLYLNGDEIQVIEAWKPPDLWEGITIAAANRILDNIEAGPEPGQRYSPMPQATKRAAWHAVQAVLPNFNEHQCRTVIKTWLGSGVLCKEVYDDAGEGKKSHAVKVVRRPG